jgi:hypothetical protein
MSAWLLGERSSIQAHRRISPKVILHPDDDEREMLSDTTVYSYMTSERRDLERKGDEYVRPRAFEVAKREQ